MKWDSHRPLAHPGASCLVSELVKSLRGESYIERRRRVVFVCGGEIKPDAKNDRSVFLRWANQNLDNDIHCLLSEEAYRTTITRTNKFINIGEFEKTLASISDCVLIFPESAGSFGELGIFATVKQIKSKTLIANRSEFQLRDSFLLQGPLHAINADSQFTPGVIYDVSSPTAPSFSEQIWMRIKESPHYLSRKRLSQESFISMPQVDQIATISWILSVTGVARFSDLLQIIRSAYGEQKSDSSKLKQTLKWMLLLKQVTNQVDDIYRTIHNPDYNLSVKGTTSKLSARFKEFWITEFPSIWGY
jgi:hypothetical protein